MDWPRWSISIPPSRAGYGNAMSDYVYPPVIAAAKLMFRLLDMKITVIGAENVPREGGAVLASNHVSYLDFIFAGLGAQESRRLCGSWRNRRSSSIPSAGR